MLSQIDQTARARVELSSAAWYDNLLIQLEKMYNEASPLKTKQGPVVEPRNWTRFDVMMPVVENVCPGLKRIGFDGDGGESVVGSIVD